MASYLTDIASYKSNIKPFTPDYKFLSNVLNQRQNMYNQGFKKLSTAYSNIVYSDLTRDDNMKLREQFVENLKPQLDKISGLDLSLQQNVNQASGIFSPFFEDEAIIDDIIRTRKYKSQVQNALLYAESDDKNVRDKYSPESIKYMQYMMEDYKNANRDDARKLSMPNYVEGINIYAEGLKFLKEQGLDMKFAPKFSDDKYNLMKITTANGEEAIPQAYSMLQNYFKSDPRIKEFYRVKSYVDARSYAEEGVANGTFATIDQGYENWSIDKISNLTSHYNSKLTELKSEYDSNKQLLRKWENYSKTKGIKPGSEEELIYESFKQKQAILEEELLNTNENLNELSSLDGEKLLNKAIALDLSLNLREDFMRSATDYAMKNKQVDYSVNEVGLTMMKHDLDLQKLHIKHQYDLELAARKAEYDREKDKDASNPFVDAVTMYTSGYESDRAKSGKDYFNMNAQERIGIMDDLMNDKVSFITDYKFSQNNGGILDLNIGGRNYKGSPDEINNQVISDIKSGKIRSGDVEKLYQRISNNIKIENPNDNMDEFYQRKSDIELKTQALSSIDERNEEVISKAHNYLLNNQSTNTSKLAKENKTIIKEDGNIMTVEEYAKLQGVDDISKNSGSAPLSVPPGYGYPSHSLNSLNSNIISEYNSLKKELSNTISKGNPDLGIYPISYTAAFKSGDALSGRGLAYSNYNFNITSATVADPRIQQAGLILLDQIAKIESGEISKSSISYKENGKQKQDVDLLKIMLNGIASKIGYDKDIGISMKYEPVYGNDKARYIITPDSEMVKYLKETYNSNFKEGTQIFITIPNKQDTSPFSINSISDSSVDAIISTKGQFSYTSGNRGFNISKKGGQYYISVNDGEESIPNTPLSRLNPNINSNNIDNFVQAYMAKFDNKF